MIELKKITKIYTTGSTPAVGLKDVSISFKKGEFVSIVGPSGSGKTTLLNVVTCMDSYEEGELRLFDKDTSGFKQEDFENYRRSNVAFIFQNYQLIDSYSALNNVCLQLMLKGVSLKEAKAQAKEILIKVGLGHRLNHKAIKLSGGEKQRVVIARALASDSQILACDEPTGNLDSENSIAIIKLLKEVAGDKLVLFVTHDPELLNDVATRVVTVKDGIIDSDKVVEETKEFKEVQSFEKRKTSFLTKLFISFMNIINTPKRSMLISLLFILSTLAVFNIVLDIGNDMREDISKRYDEVYSTVIENRLIVYSNENGDTLDVSGYSVKVENDYFLDERYLATTNIDVIHAFSCQVGLNLSSIKFGRMPKTSEEVVVSFSELYIEQTKEIDFKLDNTISFNGKNFKLVGYEINPTANNTVHFFNDNVPVLKENSSTISNDIDVVYNGLKSFNSQSSELSPEILVYVNPNDDLDKLSISIGNINIPLTSANVDYNDYLKSGQVIVNTKYVQNFISDKVYRTTYVFDNEILLGLAYENALSKGFITFSPDLFGYEKNIDYYFGLFIYVTVFVLGAFLIFILFIMVTFIIYLVLKTTIKDYTIMRIIGLDKRDVFIVSLQNILMILTMSIIVALLGSYCLYASNVLSYDLNELILCMFDPIYVVISVIILFAIGIFGSISNHIKMFSSTASTNLRGGDLL